jgi:hypothetical protein
MGLYSTQSRCSDELTTVGYGGYAVRVTPCPRSVPGRVRHPSLLAPVRLFLKMVPYSARASNSSELPVAGNGGAAAIFLGSGGRPSLSPPFSFLSVHHKINGRGQPIPLRGKFC